MLFIQYISPALITLLGNFLFYKYFQKRYEKSLEEFKISYTGIYKERIDIYREILKKIILLKFIISKYEYESKDHKNIMLKVNELLNFLKYNKPFISPKVNRLSEKIVKNLQDIFEAFYKSGRNIDSEGPFDEDIENEYWTSVNKLRGSSELKKLGEVLEIEIRSSLGLDKL